MRTPFESFWELAEAGPVGMESRQGVHTLRTAPNRSWRNQGGGARLNLTRKHQIKVMWTISGRQRNRIGGPTVPTPRVTKTWQLGP